MLRILIVAAAAALLPLKAGAQEEMRRTIILPESTMPYLEPTPAFFASLRSDCERVGHETGKSNCLEKVRAMESLVSPMRLLAVQAATTFAANKKNIARACMEEYSQLADEVDRIGGYLEVWYPETLKSLGIFRGGRRDIQGEPPSPRLQSAGLLFI